MNTYRICYQHCSSPWFDNRSARLGVCNYSYQMTLRDNRRPTSSRNSTSNSVEQSLLQKLIVVHLVKKLYFMGHEYPSPCLCPKQDECLHAFIKCSFKIHFKIIRSSTPVSKKLPLFCMLPSCNLLCITRLSHTCYMALEILPQSLQL